MKILRIIISFTLLVCTAAFLSVPVSAAAIDADEIFDEQLDASGADELHDALPDEIAQQLDSIGISPENGAQLPLSELINAVLSITGVAADSIIASVGLLAALTIFAALLERLADSAGSAMRKTSAAVISAGACVFAATPVAGYISASAACIETCCSFDMVFIPVWSAICAASGKTVLASEYGLIMATALEFASFVTKQTVLPLLRVILAVSLCSSVAPSIKLGGAVKLFEKYLKWILGFISILVAAVMGMSTAASSVMDEITAKTARFVISSAVPIVGGAMGDALSTVTGCAALLRTSVGGFGMIAMAFILLPALIKGAVWILGLNICSALADMLGVRCVKELSESVSGVISVMTALILFTAVLTIFTLAVMLGR